MTSAAKKSSDQFRAVATAPSIGRHRIVIAALILLTSAVFWRVHQNGFISYDDPDYLTDNAIVQRGFSIEGFAWAFGNVHGESTYWHPLTWLSHMLDVQLFGMNPGAHHLVSLALHIANVVILFLLLRTMTGAFWRSALVAALFALHPLQVESVSWATERKNVLSTLFWMLTLWSYVRYAAKGSAGRYILVCVVYALGLMCKPTLVTLPCVMLLLDFWPLRRLQMRPLTLTPGGGDGTFATQPVKRVLLEKVPFFALALISSWITVAAHKQLSMVGEDVIPPMSVYIGNILQSYLGYGGIL